MTDAQLLVDTSEFYVDDLPDNPVFETNELLAQMIATAARAERESGEDRRREHKWRKANTAIAISGAAFAGVAAVVGAIALIT